MPLSAMGELVCFHKGYAFYRDEMSILQPVGYPPPPQIYSPVFGRTHFEFRVGYRVS
jgi:hypothetical protein